MITQRAKLVGILGFCLYLIAFVNVLPSFYLLTWLAVGILFSCLGIALLSLVGLDCQWRVAHARVCETLEAPPPAEDLDNRVRPPAPDDAEVREPALEGPLLEVQLANGGTLNKINVLMEVRLKCAARDEILTRRFLIEALPSGASLTTLLPLSHLPRGRYRIIEMRLIGSDVLGLFRIQKRVVTRSGSPAPRSLLRLWRLVQRATAGSEAPTGANVVAELIVGPATVSLRDARVAPGTDNQVGSTGTTRLLGTSDELRGTRPYLAGDDLRRVHWRSTARHGHLIVKEFHHTAQSQTLIVWDGDGSANWGGDRGPAVEHGLRLVASVCRAFGEAGRPYTLLRLDSQPALLTSLEASATSAASLARVIDTLAEADAARAEPLAQVLAGYLASLRLINEVVLVTASCDAEVRRVAEHWRTRGARVLVGLVQGADFDRANGVGTPRTRWGWHPSRGTSLANAEQAAVATEAYLTQQQLLEENGMLVATLGPGDDPDDLVNPLCRTLRSLLVRRPQQSGYPDGQWSRRVLGDQIRVR